MSIDLGHEFFKVALMRQGSPLEIVLNTHSKRKTTTAVSFFEAIRTFGDDALAHQGKAPAKVPMFFHSTVGQNYTAADVEAGGKWWSDFGLGDKFYSYSLGYNSSRGVPTFKFSEDNEAELEETLASIFFFAKKIADASGEGKVINAKDLVVTVPSQATLRQRQALVAAGEIAGLRMLTLVHENAAFAVQRALDFSVEQDQTEYALYYNMGSRKSEVSIIRMEARSAGMVKGKTAPVVSVVGSALDYRIGGHLMDIKIAETMLQKFQSKYPKLADGVVKNGRALRKLLSQAQKCKATLSANKQAPFIVESLFEDTDFQASIKREDFEDMCADMFAVLTEPIDKALEAANVTLADIKHVEVIGGAWRVPKVQQLLSEYIEKGKGEKLALGQHLNGEEAGALGAALVAANSSTSFRIKKIFFADISAHEYAVQAYALNGAWEKNVTVLYPAGSALGGKKKLGFDSSEDFAVRLFENGVLLHEYSVTGLNDLLESKWKDYNMTGPPKISVTVPLEASGIVEVRSPTATVEESYWVNVTKEKPKPNVTNATQSSNTTDNATDAEDNATEKAEDGEESKAEDDASANDTNATEEAPEIVQKLKKKKHEKKLKVVRTDFFPMPLVADRIAELKAKLQSVADHETEVQAVAGIKNELEAAIYGARDKLEREDVVQVTTESQRDEVTKLSTEVEEWMYEPGATKADYEGKLTAIGYLTSPIDERVYELEARSSLLENTAESLEDMRKTADTVQKNMTWVNASKIESFMTKLGEFEDWWTKKQDSQAKLPLHEAPAFTAKEVQEKVAKLQKEVDKLKKTKKPKEPKAKTAKNETGSSKKGKQADEKPFPADVESAEAELETLRKKKAEAVEKEDFDAAQAMKTREAGLLNHIAELKSEAADKEKSEL